MNFQQLQKFSLSETFHDIKLTSGIEEKSVFSSHRVILAASSTYIRELLKRLPNLKTIKLPKPTRPITQEMGEDPTSKILSLCYKDFGLQALLESGFG